MENSLSGEVEFLAARGHKLELERPVLPFLRHRGFHQKLGARPMRDAVEKLMDQAASKCLLSKRATCSHLGVAEARDRLVIRCLTPS